MGPTDDSREKASCLCRLTVISTSGMSRIQETEELGLASLHLSLGSWPLFLQVVGIQGHSTRPVSEADLMPTALVFHVSFPAAPQPSVRGALQADNHFRCFTHPWETAEPVPRLPWPPTDKSLFPQPVRFPSLSCLPQQTEP